MTWTRYTSALLWWPSGCPCCMFGLLTVFEVMGMLIIGSITWVLLLIGLLSLVIPSEPMQREPGANATYYAVWLLMLGLALFLHYQVMADLHHRNLAILTDVIGVLSFVGLQCLRFRNYNVRQVENDRIPDNRIHFYWRADLSGICLDQARTVVNSDEDHR
jgi:hypothetical protein